MGTFNGFGDGNAGSLIKPVEGKSGPSTDIFISPVVSKPDAIHRREPVTLVQEKNYATQVKHSAQLAENAALKSERAAINAGFRQVNPKMLQHTV